MRVTLEMIAVLREKYREIKRLRAVDNEHRTRAVAHDPKREMAALARRFPGALRELDELPLHVIDERLALLDAALRDQSVPEWAALQVGYHGAYRFALRIKRRVAGKGALDTAALEALLAALHAEPVAHQDAELWEPSLAQLDLAELRAIVRPRDGRLHSWVLQHVAARAGVPAAAISAALFLRERTLSHSF